MKLPPGKTEEEVVESITRIVKILAKKFRFGFHSVEDLKQEGAFEAIKVLNKGLYDPSRPLDNFLYTHIRNRLINFKRDHAGRNEPPCKTCPFYDPKCKKSTNQCAEFPDKNQCKKLADWKSRNNAKQSIMSPLDVSVITDNAIEQDGEAYNDATYAELIAVIDKDLPVELRSDYLRMIDGAPVPRARKQKVREAILAIRTNYYGTDQEED
jgi:DNA-directed RNA polymerase specialized sigma24 family protein